MKAAVEKLSIGEVLPIPEGMLVVAHFGAGANSSAMLHEWVRLGLPLHLVLFSDTGGERPSTYAHVERLSAWLVSRGYPPVIVTRYTRRGGELETLEGHSLSSKRLPSLAYGFKSCSQRFKRDPQTKYLNNWAPAREAWKRGEKVLSLIGYDADEPQRARNIIDRNRRMRIAIASGEAPAKKGRTYYDLKKYVVRFPLLEWDWGREECIAACEEQFGQVPSKSSCFFCPAMRPEEIRELAVLHPELLDRAIALEANAESTSGKLPKLGRWLHWGDFVKNGFKRIERTVSQPEAPCDCMDG
jgi:3'-phosphoadenosine 5'-phosphosulfate sulfotransferase (PAPS reductase)/FAD synthetase